MISNNYIYIQAAESQRPAKSIREVNKFTRLLTNDRGHLTKQLPQELQPFVSELRDFLADGLQERAGSKTEQRRFTRSETWSLQLLIWRKRLVRLVVRRERMVRW